MSMYRRRMMIANALEKFGINYPGLIAAWSAKGKTNDDEDRAILKDLTGNGHDITLNGFAFSEMSGYGGYNVDFINTSGKIKPERVDGTATGIKINITQVKNTNNFIENTSNKIIPSFKIKVTGISDNGVYIKYRYYLNVNGSSMPKLMELNSDGIYTLPQTDETKYNGFLGSTVGKCNITIELLPEYPDALVFDGVDDYGINENMPILTDFTVIAKRKFINNGKGALLSKANDTKSAFVFEGGDLFQIKIWSFGFDNNIDVISDDISYMTTFSYNGISLKKGTITDTNKIFLGGYRYWQGAFYSAYLFDRSLDEQEIKSFIRKYIDPEYLLPSEIPTPDCYYDFSLGSNDDENRETIKDQSGNGNDAKAYNFAWNEEGSGYKDGALYLDGTDDYIALEAFDSGFKTVFMLCSWKIENVMNYDQRNNNDYENALNTSSQDINYYGRNRSGKTYINGILSTKVKNNLTRNKKHLITGTFFGGSNTTTPCIGSNNSGNGYFSNLTLYKFLGFKEELTEEQIKAIIKKYNLLDGVDEIEVS